MAPPNRPYRVGMDRPAQRYVEPDEIYEDMARGRPTTIPREFGNTWNPVNGVPGLMRRGLGGPAEDLFASIVKAGQNVVSTTQGAIEDGGKQAALDAINSSPAGKALLDAVQGRAADGVTSVVKKQGVNLILLGAAAGVVGGAVASKTGKLGVLAAMALAGWAAMQILEGVKSEAAKK